MGILVAFLHRYLSPFVAGVCMAGATVVDSLPMAAVLIVSAALSCFFSLPVGGRMVSRVAGVAS